MAVIGLPLICLVNDISVANWPRVYAVMAAILVPVALASCFLASLFGQIAYSKLAFSVSVVIFGAATPLAVFGFLSMSVFALHGSFIGGFATPEGIKNALFLFLLFGLLGAAMCWSGFRKIKGSG